MNRPFVWISLAYISGILTAKFLSIPYFYAWLGAACFLLLAMLCLILKRPRIEILPNDAGTNQADNKIYDIVCRKNVLSLIPIFLTIFSTGILSYQIHSHVPRNNISHFISTKKEKVILKGRVIGPVDRESAGHGRRRSVLTLGLEQVRFDKKRQNKDNDIVGDKNLWRNVTGKVIVYIYGGEKQRGNRLRYGDELIVKASISRPSEPSNPGQFDYQLYLERRNISAVAMVKDHLNVVRVGRADYSKVIGPLCGPVFGPVLVWIYDLRYTLERVIDKSLKGTEAELLKAMLLGRRQGISDSLKDTFIKTGTVHVLAISGLHTGLVAFSIMIFLRLLRVPKKVRYGLGIVILIGFAFLTGLKPPVVRAVIMAVLVMAAVLLNREADTYNCLGLAVLLMLIINPDFIFDAGFQLSFTAVISIVCFYGDIRKQLFGRVMIWIQDNYDYEEKSCFKYKCFNILLLVLKHSITLFCVSLTAWLGTMPIVWYYFNIISPVALVVNIMAVPLLFLSVSSGLCLCLTALFWPEGAIVLWSGVCWLWLKMLVLVNALFSQIEFGYFYLSRPEIYFVLFYYLIIILIIKKNNICQENRLKRFRSRAAVLVLLNLIIWPSIINRPDVLSKNLKVTFLDVGHGDSAFVRFPGGGNMLIDTGLGPPNDMGRWVVQPFLLYNNIRRLDILLLTHCDYDHVGGMGIILDNFKIGSIFDNGTAENLLDQEIYEKDTGYDNYLKMFQTYGRKSNSSPAAGLRSNTYIRGYPGPVRIEVLHPQQEMISGTLSDDNNNSVVLKITYGRVSFLFCGDIEEAACIQLLGLGEKLRSDILKVSHHGAKIGLAGKLFIEQVRPKIAVISEGKNNRFGLPHKSTVKLLQELDCRILQTSKHGAITVSTDGSYICTETFH